MAEELARIPNFFRGDTVPIDLELTDNGVADDLTGCELWFTIKTDEGDADTAAKLQHRHSVPNGPDAVAGKTRMIVPSNKTDAVPPGDYVCDLQRVRPGNPPDVWTLFKQKIKVLADVSRSIS